MKKFIKNYLMLLMTIVTFMALTMFAASAEGCSHNYPSYEGNVISATCTDEGYTEVRCGLCHEVIGRVPNSTVPAKGHDYKWDMIADGDHFVKRGDCKVCTATTYEFDKNNNKVIYYSVELKNPAAAKTYDVSYSYVKLVDKRCGLSDAADYTTLYFKKDEVVELPDKPHISCEKDEKYGKYDFIGWFDEDAGFVFVDSGDEGDEALKGKTNYLETETKAEKNMVLYAGFRGVDVSYSVTFFNSDGKYLGSASSVPHGKAVSDKKLGTPTQDDDTVNRYTFDYWSYKGNEVKLNKIYADVDLTAHYLVIPKQYNIEYYFDAECTQPIINMNDVVKDSGIYYGDPATNGLQIPKTILQKAKDDAYVYEWTGKWVFANRNNYEVSLEALTVPVGTPDALDGSSCIRLIPQYVKKNRIYDLKVVVNYPDDSNYHPEEVFVQLTYSDGTIADARYINKVNDTTYEYTFTVNYSEYYTIAATATGYTGEAVSRFFSNSFDPDSSHPSGAVVTMEKVAAHSCGCICHTFLKPVWIRVLRLLHTLFGVEHVCCSDMFANIGSSLNYGPGKS